MDGGRIWGGGGIFWIGGIWGGPKLEIEFDIYSVEVWEIFGVRGFFWIWGNVVAAPKLEVEFDLSSLWVCGVWGVFGAICWIWLDLATASETRGRI